MTQKLGPQNTPRALRIAAPSPLTGALLDMSGAGWQCEAVLHYPYGTPITTPQTITDTVLLTDTDTPPAYTNLAHFNVTMSDEEARAHLLLRNGLLLTTDYYWVISVWNDPLDALVTLHEKLEVSHEYGAIDSGAAVVVADPVVHGYNPAGTTPLSSGVELSQLALKRSASGGTDPHGHRIAQSADELLGADEFNRLLAIVNKNGMLLHDHVINTALHGGVSGSSATGVWELGNTERRISVYEGGVLVEYVATETATAAQIGAIAPGTNTAVWLAANYRSLVIGDGAQTTFVFNHGLTDGHVVAQLRNNATGEIEKASIRIVGDTATVNFATAPAVNSFTIEVSR